SQSDSIPPMFAYWFCIISRVASVSRLLPPLSATVPGALAQVLPVRTSVGPVNVELAVLFQSTWNFQTRTRSLALQTEAYKFSRPVGGVPTWARALLGRSVK